MTDRAVSRRSFVAGSAAVAAVAAIPAVTSPPPSWPKNWQEGTEYFSVRAPVDPSAPFREVRIYVGRLVDGCVEWTPIEKTSPLPPDIEGRCAVDLDLSPVTSEERKA